MPSRAIWGPLAVLVAGGVVLMILFEDDEGQRAVDTGRLTVSVAPDGERVPPQLAGVRFDVELARGGDLVRVKMEEGEGRHSNPNGPEGELILDGDDVFFWPYGPGLPGGNRWIRLDPDAAGRILPGILGFADPGWLLSTTSAFEDEEPAGNDVIRGVETTRYELTREWREAGEDESSRVLEEMRAAIGDRFRASAWVDGEGFIRRLVIPMEARYFSPRAREGTIDVQYDVYDLGADVTIEVPDEGDLRS
ncbi:MAG: hypothetical protein M3279_13235 [Actinomycetota bacterium]|nr:hypothetical protein [Actinomycetota bacterium]